MWVEECDDLLKNLNVAIDNMSLKQTKGCPS